MESIQNSNQKEDLVEISKQYVFKYVVIGDSGVGKTSILHYFVYNKCKAEFIKSRNNLNRQ